MNQCDICNKTEHETTIYVGRWIFYCSEHKSIDYQKTLDNEVNNNYDNLNELDNEVLELLI